ncbi:hypothetical protein ASD15_08805 [Massilia sp. Root351]|uniref:DUF4349 domain-containing protein n=1 Tax=Massilia sp. Root351 TaxID=1736522 RepID=UPI00070E17AA|nr:DUF4349 domain-containing protein [Massilia sp. Root351]KQV85199.1 hypothetical protein ASD15_08805 [Massilia sp. Root351]
MKRWLWMGLLALTACGGPVETGAQGGAALKEGGRGQFLAYEHTVSIDTDEAQVRPLADKLVAACQADRENNCTLLESGSSQGRDPSAHVKLRAKPAGVARLVALASAGGSVQSRQTHVDDLAKSIIDSNKRLDMLRDYERKLKGLEDKAGNSIDTLMKLSKELASVQSELEQATGQNAHLLERVNLDLLTVRIDAHHHRSFWSLIGSALSEFTQNLSQGVSSLVTGLAYLLPWLLAAFMAWLGGRRLWRKFKRK